MLFFGEVLFGWVGFLNLSIWINLIFFSVLGLCEGGEIEAQMFII
jgi:hypothetical protein